MGVVEVRFTVCPLCGHVFSHYEHRWQHFLDRHDPEDAGLSPLGTIPADVDAPLFRDVEEQSGGEARAD